MFLCRNGSCPLGDICGSHRAYRPESRITISPTVNIYEVLGSGEQRPVTDLGCRRWMVYFVLQAVQQVLHNPAWDTGLLGRVDKTEKDEILQEYPPVYSETLEQALPVKLYTARVQQVYNVCPVIAFAFHDIALRPE